MTRSTSSICLAFALIATALARTPFQISDDRELKELDLSAWDCRPQLEGSAKTPDGIERNRLKNRSAPGGSLPPLTTTDVAGFRQRVSAFDAKTKNKRRKDLTPAEKQELDALENQIVQVEGYLVLAYAGPTESTNCGSVDFHDWHLEIFEKPAEHAPQPGDPTPIVCEITPRTQNAIYRDNIRIQELTGFFRQADLDVVPTGHKPQKIRLTGYLLWDDEHNGASDVGSTIERVGANKYHQPWRATAWEIHPVIKVERADGVSAPANERTIEPPAPTNAPTSAPSASAQQVVTLMQPVKIKIPYGETVLPRGATLPVVTHDANTVTVRFMNKNQVVPISSTDLHQ